MIDVYSIRDVYSIWEEIHTLKNKLFPVDLLPPVPDTPVTDLVKTIYDEHEKNFHPGNEDYDGASRFENVAGSLSLAKKLVQLLCVDTTFDSLLAKAKLEELAYTTWEFEIDALSRANFEKAETIWKETASADDLKIWNSRPELIRRLTIGAGGGGGASHMVLGPSEVAMIPYNTATFPTYSRFEALGTDQCNT